MCRMTWRMIANDWQKHPWFRFLLCAVGAVFAAVWLLAVLAGELAFPGPPGTGGEAFAFATFLGLLGGACWRGGTRAWEDLGRPAVPARTREMVYAALAVPVVIALPGLALGAGYGQDWLGAGLAAAGIWAWWRFGRHAAAAPVPAPAPGPGPERLH